MFEYTVGHDNAFGISINNSYLSQFHNIANKELMNINFGVNVYDVDFIRRAKDTDLDKIVEAEVDELINSKVEKFKSPESKSKSAADLETDLEQLSDMEEFNE